MKFEEAKKEILKGTYPCYSECLDDENCEIHGSTSYIHVMGVIDKLKKTYAPRVKMPQKIMLVFMEMKFNYQVDFEFFWKLMGDCVATDYLRKNYKEEEIMMAWLHPELIEVVFEK